MTDIEVSYFAERTAEILLECGAVELRPDNPVPWSSGGLHPVYTDVRLTMSYPKAKYELIEQFNIRMMLMKEDPTFQFQGIAGVFMAGVVYGASLANCWEVPILILGSDLGPVYGPLERDTTYLTIEDIYSTGRSTIRAVEGLKEEAKKEFPDNMVPVATHSIAVMSYGWPEIQTNFEAAGLKGLSLTTFPTVLKIAKQTGMINSRMATEVEDWYEDPKDWVERNNKVV